MSRDDFLFELGSEELPPKNLRRLMDALAASFATQLDAAGLGYAGLRAFATPRRLAVLVRDLDAQQPDVAIERRGPPVKIAFDGDGNPTKAAAKFIASCGVGIDDLSTTKTDKGEWLFYQGIEKGKSSAELLPAIAAQALADLPIAKRMRWGARSDEFVRPVHWLVMLLGGRVLDTTVLGVDSGRRTYGHRFHAPRAIELQAPGDYEDALQKNGHVVADFDKRRARIEQQIEAEAVRLGGSPVVDDALLDEVSALVEWPVAVAGEFEARFLALPAEVLISALKDHQRYFPLTDADGALMPYFITISNIESRDPQAVKHGNERVVRPRLADAAFFYDQDRKTSLQQRCAALANVLFQKQLGSLADKTDRVVTLSRLIADGIGGDPVLAADAAAVSKCDLLTEMVGEFPDLQGTMGRYYALHDGRPDELASALEEQYLPRFAGGPLACTKTGQALALADRLDTLAGIFAIGKRPSGTSDPFGLRRAAVGVLRTIIEQRLDLDLEDLVGRACEAVMPMVTAAKKPPYANHAALTNAVYGYMTERLRGMFVDDADKAIDSGMFEAVLATAPGKPLDFAERLYAVRDFMGLEESASLCAANKRIANILKSADDTIPQDIDPGLLREEGERALYETIDALRGDVREQLATRQYGAALSALAGLRVPVDRFFDDVMVMADDAALRVNRLALLSELRRLFLHTADFSKIQ